MSPTTAFKTSWICTTVAGGSFIVAANLSNHAPWNAAANVLLYAIIMSGVHVFGFHFYQANLKVSTIYQQPTRYWPPIRSATLQQLACLWLARYVFQDRSLLGGQCSPCAPIGS
ncbi:MAG TPA: hypothetical protein VFE24_05890 [Pirellulales bacterium]|nr:hypothetical protein [Pirellulales bacterium]